MSKCTGVSYGDRPRWATLYRWDDGWSVARPLWPEAIEDLMAWSIIPRSLFMNLLTQQTFVMLDPNGEPRAGYLTVIPPGVDPKGWPRNFYGANKSDALVDYQPRRYNLPRKKGQKHIHRRPDSVADWNVMFPDQIPKWRAFISASIERSVPTSIGATMLVPVEFPDEVFLEARRIDQDEVAQSAIREIHEHQHKVDLVSAWLKDQGHTWDWDSQDDILAEADTFESKHGFSPFDKAVREPVDSLKATRTITKVASSPISRSFHFSDSQHRSSEPLVVSQLSFNFNYEDQRLIPYEDQRLIPYENLEIFLMKTPEYGITWVIGERRHDFKPFPLGGNTIEEAIRNLDWVVKEGELEAWYNSNAVDWGYEVAPMNIYIALNAPNPIMLDIDEFRTWYSQLMESR